MRLKRFKRELSVLLAVLVILLVPWNTVYAQGEVKTGAKAYALVEASSGRVLSEYNADEKLPMASTTKIMTCLLACEMGNMDEVITVTKQSVGLEGTSMYLREGETVTLRELCYGLMLLSGNDAAMAIACHLGGDMQGFAKLMNERAIKAGAVNTNFVTPNGLPAEGHYTTARDLVLIAATAMQNELFKEIVGTQQMTLAADEDSPERYLKSKNKILYNYEGGNGVKTGYTKAAGKCLVAGAKRGDMQLIAVVLNDYGMFDDCAALLDYGFENYTLTDVTQERVMEDYLTVYGGVKKCIDIEKKHSIYLPLCKIDSRIYYEYEIIGNIAAPIFKGDTVGRAKYYLNGELMGEVPLIAGENNPANDFAYRLKKLIRSFLGMK